MSQTRKRPAGRPGAASSMANGDAGYSTIQRCRRIDFSAVNAAALAVLPTLLKRWLPDGRRQGKEYVARNPHRDDRHLGSFCINLNTGRWADFATGDRGGDPVSLAAYLFDLSQVEAARRLADMLRLRS
jgi:hypothetical protein